jgi:chlorite dismutase
LNIKQQLLKLVESPITMTNSLVEGKLQTRAMRDERDRRLTKRQYVRFVFYRIDPVWRRLLLDEQADHKRELVTTIESFDRRMLLRPYSLMGTRADAELLLWQIAESVEPFQELATAISSSRMGGYLNLSASYLSQTAFHL